MIDVNPFIQSGWTSQATFAFTLIVILILPITILKRRRQHPYPVAPGALPFLGHALALANSDKFLTVLTQWKNDIGQDGIFEFSIFGRRWIVVYSADTYMHFMGMRSSKIKRASIFSDAIASLGVNGMFNAEGHVWKNDRRIVVPTLNKNHIEDYFPFVKLVANRLVSKWKNEEGVAVSALTDLSKYALDVIALSVLGIDLDSMNNPDSELAKDIENFFQFIFVRSLSPVQFWKIPLCSNLDGGRNTSERVLQSIRGLVRDYRERLDDGNNNQKEQKRETKICLQKLIDISDRDDAKLDEDRVVGNLATLMLAGTDTTSNTLAVCLWEIAHDAKLHDELYNEIAESGKDLESLTMSDVMNGFPRLHSLLFEVLRIKNSTPLLFLEPAEDVEFRGGLIKPGDIICAMTRSPGEKAASDVPTGPNGEGPETFCPHRWLVSQNESFTVMQPTNENGGFMPFGHGLRACPGAKLAKVEVLTGLIYILRSFELAPMENHPPVERVMRFTETFDGEIKLMLKTRI
mmetsp:Transcript_24895/g.53706  ORF Transcript_24895/g.53706 Transcript_24895/m.53706 type:complete len:519 (+) Transcript_24895:160-1716(+)|eukprot:CAMPEP_0172299892 /NCGR_PEP_ID=MMETSP1058-20130122/2075_1 /TAXON_ID=83371 /ORGANISM="Detonula confervacea, Strain CCMP 353" /LENGTH=518 /DNA_ID=CAMNT_0013009477 /DNA_START=74 /DNA_END=1630 /DNA_ORIENTATION=+